MKSYRVEVLEKSIKENGIDLPIDDYAAETEGLKRGTLVELPKTSIT